jgi:hypothetical protein
MGITVYSTKTTPYIDFKDGHLQIRGKSIPTLNLNFYHELLMHIESYVKNPTSITILDIDLDLINCYSKKWMMQIFYQLEKLQLKGNKILINWYYSEEDVGMIELGLIYYSMINIPFKFIKKG